jgi:DNA-binding transcriptional regulator GbsR (MarR family)
MLANMPSIAIVVNYANTPFNPSHPSLPHSLDIPSLMSDISVMTETSDTKDMTAAAQSFVLHWGDMGVHWGMSRSTCQVQALLYLAERPLNAEEIVNTLKLARSNISTSLKELLNWNLIRRVPMPNDRRDHYAAETDVWEIAKRISTRRKEQEIDPALVALRDCVALAGVEKNPETLKRLTAMLQFTEKVDKWYGDMLRIPRAQLEYLFKIGSKVVGFLPKAK